MRISICLYLIINMYVHIYIFYIIFIQNLSSLEKLNKYSSLPNRKQLIIVKNFKYFYNFHNIVVNFFQYVENLFIFIPLFVYAFELCIFYVAEYKITKNIFAISTYVYMVKVPFCYQQNVSFFLVKKTLKYTAIYLIDFKSILYLKKRTS